MGHYMAAVAEQLIADGLPVNSGYAYAAWDERTSGMVLSHHSQDRQPRLFA